MQYDHGIGYADIRCCITGQISTEPDTAPVIIREEYAHHRQIILGRYEYTACGFVTLFCQIKESVVAIGRLCIQDTTIAGFDYSYRTTDLFGVPDIDLRNGIPAQKLFYLLGSKSEISLIGHEYLTAGTPKILFYLIDTGPHTLNVITVGTIRYLNLLCALTQLL